MIASIQNAELYIPAKSCPVEITFQGLATLQGQLLRASPSKAHIAVEAESIPGKKCFIRGEIDGQPFYTRGKCKGREDDYAVVGIENGALIYKFLARSHIYHQPSTMDRMVTSKKIRPIVQRAADNEDTRRKQNCWEVSNCGKENYCLAGTSTLFDGMFGGRNGGRFCAFIDGTLCKDGAPMDPEEKIRRCASCHFFKEIVSDAIDGGYPADAAMQTA